MLFEIARFKLKREYLMCFNVTGKGQIETSNKHKSYYIFIMQFHVFIVLF